MFPATNGMSVGRWLVSIEEIPLSTLSEAEFTELFESILSKTQGLKTYEQLGFDKADSTVAIIVVVIFELVVVAPARELVACFVRKEKERSSRSGSSNGRRNNPHRLHSYLLNL
jgi:hypothetical protein